MDGSGKCKIVPYDIVKGAIHDGVITVTNLKITENWSLVRTDTHEDMGGKLNNKNRFCNNCKHCHKTVVERLKVTLGYCTKYDDYLKNNGDNITPCKYCIRDNYREFKNAKK